MLKRLFASIVFFLALLPASAQFSGGPVGAQAQFAQFTAASGVAPTTTVWAALKIGAGGFITGIDISNDGTTKVVRTDTYGAWISVSNGAWSQLMTTASMPSGDSDLSVTDTQVLGVFEVAVAPGDATRIYMYFNGYVFVSSNRGTTFTRTAFSQVAANPNTGTKLFGRFIAVDPNNADVVYVGTPSSGLFVSFDAGASFAHVSGVASAGSSNGTIIQFDPSSSVVSSKTQIIFASSYGTGVYRSTNGGTSWTLTTSTPTTHRHMFCDQNGVLWLTDNSGSSPNLNKFASSTWSKPALGTDRGYSIAVDPANASRIFVGIDSGDLVISTNGGTSWVGPTFGQSTRTATDIPWLGWTNEDYMSNGDMKFDPITSNKLWFAEGIGVWYTNPPNTNTTVPWTSQSAAIEQLVSNMLISPPTGVPLAFFWDRAVFRVVNPATYPSTHGPTNAFEYGGAGDYAPGTPSFIVGTFAAGAASSSDGGVIWTRWSSNPTGVTDDFEGAIAVSTTSNWAYVPLSPTGDLWVTANAGVSWTKPSLSGVPTSGDRGWTSGLPINRGPVCADRVTAGTFYAYNNGDVGYAGVWKSTDAGVNWARIKSGYFTSEGVDGFNGWLKCVPGNAGHVFWSGGQVGGSTTGSFFRTTDAGANWSAVPNVLEVYAFGFGKAKTGGGGYPAIYIAGFVSGTFGIWRSDDGEQATPTWTNIGPATNSFDFIKVVEGDTNIYGTVYVGFEGSGFAYGHLN